MWMCGDKVGAAADLKKLSVHPQAQMHSTVLYFRQRAVCSTKKTIVRRIALQYCMHPNGPKAHAAHRHPDLSSPGRAPAGPTQRPAAAARRLLGPAHHGRRAFLLQAMGLEVVTGVVNPSFFIYKLESCPCVATGSITFIVASKYNI
jgi:hypothetical protein